MGFWEGETCEHCGGPIREAREPSSEGQGKVRADRTRSGRGLQAVRHAYFAANVLKMIEESVHGRRPAKRQVMVPSYRAVSGRSCTVEGGRWGQTGIRD